jgi:hypothetical protein
MLAAPQARTHMAGQLLSDIIVTGVLVTHEASQSLVSLEQMGIINYTSERMAGQTSGFSHVVR